MGEVAARAEGKAPSPRLEDEGHVARGARRRCPRGGHRRGGRGLPREEGRRPGRREAGRPDPRGFRARVASSAPAPAAPSTAGPAVAVVETPAPSAPPTAVPTKKARVKPTVARRHVRGSRGCCDRRQADRGSRKPADLTVTIRRFLKVDVSPSQARVFLDGNYIGISDDWDDAGGGTLLTFNLEGQHRLRICSPEYRDLLVDLIVRSTATDDKVTIEQDLEKGTPDGPTGPEGKLKRPSYRTVGAVLFNVDPPDATVTVNGRELGPASKWAKEEMIFRDMAVYEVGLTAPGYEPKTVRLLVAPTAGEVRATIKEKLKKL